MVGFSGSLCRRLRSSNVAGKPLKMTGFLKRKLIELNGGFSGDGTESPEGTLR